MTLIGRSVRSRRTWRTAPLAENSTPICSSFQRTTPKCSSEAPTRFSSPPVMAAAMANTPASIRSGITVCSVAVSSLTPRTVTNPVPPPLMSAPILERNAMTSSTSGSRAQLSITVVPGAMLAAMIRFSVPVCDGVSRYRWAPRSLPALMWMTLSPSSTMAPSRAKPRYGKSEVPAAQVAAADALDHRFVEPVQKAGTNSTEPRTGVRSRPAAPGWSPGWRRRPRGAFGFDGTSPLRPRPAPVLPPGGRPQ